jgi:hypothetical protein
MTTTKKQKIVEAISLLNDEKEQISPNTYGCVRDALTDIKCIYVLKWISLVPVVQAFEDGSGEYITYIQLPCSSLVPLTIYQSDMIENNIRVGSNSISTVLFWQDIGYTSSVPRFGAHMLRLNGTDVVINEWSVLQSIVEYNNIRSLLDESRTYY